MNLYLNRKKDTPEEIKAKGTRLDARLASVKKTRKGWQVTCTVERDEFYAGRSFTELKDHVPNEGIGVLVGLYIDDVDADGEFYIDV